jgi:hypothetical protein
MSRRSAPRYAAGLLTGCALVLSATACSSTANTSTAGSASPTATAAATGTSSALSGKPGCNDAVQAFRDASANMATKVQDLPSLQAYVTTLVAKLRTAATSSTDPAVQSAVTKLADDFNALVTAAQTSNGSQIQTVLSSFVTDGQALVKVCTG